MRRLALLLLVIVLLTMPLIAFGQGQGHNDDDDTQVPGHNRDRYDQDDNGIPDAGVMVNGHYTSVYAYDGTFAYYWDLGDGRIYTSSGINSIADLDQATLTVCDYVINYRADFGNDAFMDSGWIQNLISCHGYDDNGQYNYLIVSRDDPRFHEEYESPGWGPDWRYSVLTISGEGNVANPILHQP